MLDSQTGMWHPQFDLDLDSAKPKQFNQFKEKYLEYFAEQPELPALTLETGWVTITPQLAEELLQRNKSNRFTSFADIKKYAQSMLADDWQPTGQPILFDEKGVFLDGQHRLWACVISGAAFTTFVVTGVKAGQNLFAYIDNAKSRTSVDALFTAGYKEATAIVNGIITVAQHMDAGMYSVSGVAPAAVKRQPVDTLRAVPSYPNIETAARNTHNRYGAAHRLIPSDGKSCVGYVAMRIIDLHDEDTANSFFAELTDTPGQYDEDDAVERFRALVEEHHESVFKLRCDKNAKIKMQPLKAHEWLGNLIITFNHWIKNESMPKKKAWVASGEEWPTIAGPSNS